MRYKGIPDRYRQVYHTGWQCGEIPSASGTGFPPGDVIALAFAHYQVNGIAIRIYDGMDLCACHSAAVADLVWSPLFSLF